MSLKKITPIFLVLCSWLALPGVQGQASTIDSDTSQEALLEVKSKYFNLLDYYTPEGIAKIPAFETMLYQKTKPMMERSSEELTHLDGQWLALAAMYIVNTDMGIREGLIDPQILPQEQLFTKSTNRDDILIARQHVVADMLTQGTKADPTDPKISGWLSANRLELSVIENREPTVLEKKGYAEEVKKSMFDFFGIYIASNRIHYSEPEFDQALEDSAREILKQKLPCGGGSATPKEDCKKAKAIPHAVVASLTTVGDYFAQQYDKTPASESEKKADYLKQAKKAWLYASIPFITGFNRHSWSGLEAFRERKEAYRGAHPKSTFDWTSQKAHQMLSCMSCHSN